MKTNKYSDLIKFGLKPKTLMTLSESDIHRLHESLINRKSNKKISEQVTTKQVTAKEFPVSQLDKGPISTTGTKTITKQGDKLIVQGEVEESDKDNKKNPWAICHSQLGPKKTPKFERCVREVKKSIKEGKNYFDILLERKIVSLLEKHMSPKITKGELLNLLETKKMKTPIGKLSSFGVKTENKDSDTKTKPTTKPGTKTPPKEKPLDPFKPSPHKQPKPKAKKEETKEQFMDAPAKPATKPTTKPGTKTPPKEKPLDPFKPSPHKQPKPKAKRKLPEWLTFNSLGIKFKK